MTNPGPRLRSAAAMATLAAATAFASACATPAGRAVPSTDDPHLATAYRVLSTTPLIDGHNDLPWAIRGYDEAPMDIVAYDLRQRTPGHTDLERLRQGMVGGQFWSVYVPAGAALRGAARIQLEQIDIAKRVIERYPELELALTADDVERIFAEGRIASMLGMEGGHAIENSLGALRAFYDLGARYMTLTHSANIDWADSCCEAPDLGGLSSFGEEVVREMNRLGMLVDISHVSPETMNDVLNLTAAPVIFSHSSARGVTDHVRNVPDQVLRRMPENGGVVMVTFVTVFVSEALRRWSETPESERMGAAPRPTMDDVIAHIEHVRDVAGIDHVGLGGDYDGATTPEGLEDVSTYPALFAELSRRGWSEADLRKLAGENILRAWRQAESASARLRAERPASTATIAVLDGVVPEGSGAFVTRLGRDTLAVERFRHGPTSFHAEVLLRSPETRLTVYDAELDAAGNILALDAVAYDPAGVAAGSFGEPIGRTTWRFGDGSVAVTTRRGGETRESTIEAPTHAIPFIDMVHWPYELAMIRGIAESGDEMLPMLQGRGTGDFGFLPAGSDSLTLRHPFRGTMGVRRAPNGGIARLDAGNTTRALVVDRVREVDVAGLARRYAGRSVGELSGRGEAEGTIGRANIVVDYGVPKKRGREIFGALVDYGEVWRTGANRATHLVTDRDLVIGGTRVPAGTYTLFTIPGRDRWTLVVNRRTDIGGTSYDASADLARVPMEVRTLPEPVEDFTIVVDPAGFLRLRWDRTEAFVGVTAR